MIKFYLSLLLLVIAKTIFCQIPEGYYSSAANKAGTELQLSLHDIIDGHTVISYNAIWDAFYSTDRTSDDKVWDIYSDIPVGSPAYTYSFVSNQCGNYSGEGDCYNREHSFPKSWFNEESPMVSDLFQVYPTDGYVNGRRGNYPYGETNSPTWASTNGSKLGPCSYSGYNGTVFEPINEYKGDLARTYFYMATRYYGEDGDWAGSDMVEGSQPKAWALAMLLEWDENDPVSQKEIDRNNAIYAIQGNRNPFIDHPEYVGYVWEGVTPDDPVVTEAPSNAVLNFSGSFITLNWTDASGENLPGGYLIVYNTEGFQSLPVPVDGTSPQNYSMSKVVSYGVGHCILPNLQQKTKYYIKIYSFSGSGNLTDYKTDGSVPQLEKITN